MQFFKKQSCLVLNFLFGLLMSVFAVSSQAEVLGHVHSEQLGSFFTSVAMSPNGNYFYELDIANFIYINLILYK
jgi:hypothetical protein